MALEFLVMWSQSRALTSGVGTWGGVEVVWGGCGCVGWWFGEFG